MSLAHISEIRVAVIASHPITIAGLAAVINAQSNMTVVATASSVAGGLSDIMQAEPEAVIVELGPANEGLPVPALVDALRHQRNRASVIAFAEEPEHVVTALKAGARGFLLKDCPTDDIVTGVRQAVRGAVPVSPRTLPHLVSEVMAPTAPPALSRREREVLALVARGQSNPRIAQSLHVSEATVKTHMRRVFHKLQANDRASAVALAISKGMLAPNESQTAGHPPSGGDRMEALRPRRDTSAQPDPGLRRAAARAEGDAEALCRPRQGRARGPAPATEAVAHQYAAPDQPAPAHRGGR
ncbi:LuxR C-terminal-related transcriptional regulator [Streptomyces wuyuanensis]|uniref:LuxR C-terminal-related transcriptional regulator n=1 Tax=Streptomyces wuyuanensis TaxID=1196353 RepID=UPI003D726D51